MRILWNFASSGKIYSMVPSTKSFKHFVLEWRNLRSYATEMGITDARYMVLDLTSLTTRSKFYLRALCRDGVRGTP